MKKIDLYGTKIFYISIVINFDHTTAEILHGKRKKKKTFKKALLYQGVASAFLSITVSLQDTI